MDKIRSAIERTSDKNIQPTNPGGKTMTANFLKSTGLFDAYEHVVSSMVEDGWPDNQSIFDHASYLLLKWQTEHMDEIAISSANYRKSTVFTQNEGSHGVVQQFKNTQNVENMKQHIRNDSKQIGGGPKRIQLKSKKSYNFSQNKIEVSVFEGVPQRALTAKKNNEEYEKRKKVLAIEDEYGSSFPSKIQTTKPERVYAQKVDEYEPTIQISEVNKEINEIQNETQESIQTQDKPKVSQNVLEDAMKDIAEGNRQAIEQDIHDADQDDYEDDEFDATGGGEKIPQILKDQNRIKIVEKEDEIIDNYE